MFSNKENNYQYSQSEQKVNNTYPINLIVAFDNNYLIGKDYELPWDYPEDVKYFHEKTLNSTVIMGYRTMECLKKPLKDRINIVINRNVHGMICEKGFFHVNSLKKAIEYNNEYFHKTIFIIGGTKIYEEALLKFNLNLLFITKINKNFEGNIYFPKMALLENYILDDSYRSNNHPELFYETWIKK